MILFGNPIAALAAQNNRVTRNAIRVSQQNLDRYDAINRLTSTQEDKGSGILVRL